MWERWVHCRSQHCLIIIWCSIGSTRMWPTLNHQTTRPPKLTPSYQRCEVTGCWVFDWVRELLRSSNYRDCHLLLLTWDRGRNIYCITGICQDAVATEIKSATFNKNVATYIMAGPNNGAIFSRWQQLVVPGSLYNQHLKSTGTWGMNGVLTTDNLWWDKRLPSQCTSGSRLNCFMH